MIADADFKSQIAERNAIRTEAKLPLLDEREFAKLRATRDQRIFESVFASERARFSDAWRNKRDWFSGYGEWSRARDQVRQELRMGIHLDVVLRDLGYRLVEDAWDRHGRRSYLSDEDADRQALMNLQTTLAEYGWIKDEHRLRCFRCAATGEFIVIEPGGSEVTGDLLHYLKSE